MVHPHVVPAILAYTKREFAQRLDALAGVAPLLHVDVMDGSFVPNRSWANPSAISSMGDGFQYSVHLMVQHPMRRIAAWSRMDRCESLIVHVETDNRIEAPLSRIRAAGKRAGIAINPSTSLDALIPQIPNADIVLVLANAPGFAGRPFQSSTLRRIRALRAKFPKLTIGVDIGVNLKTAPRIRAAGASYVVAGSAIFNSKEPVRAYRTLQRAFRKP
jgi:ribulose-phosphate 3-epimerase